jgi:hypothetical protein
MKLLSSVFVNMSKAFIFDLDLTLTTDSSVDIKRITTLLDWINEFGHHIYIVTARKLDTLSEDYSSDNINAYESSLLNDKVDDSIYNLILKNLNIRMRNMEDIPIWLRNMEDIPPRFKYALNRNPETRWFYYYSDSDEIPGVYNDFCVVTTLDKQFNLLDGGKITPDIEARYRKGLLTPNEHGLFLKMKGMAKMIQIQFIKHYNNHKWENMYFFDDAYYNYNSFCRISKIEQGYKKINYISNNGYDCNDKKDITKRESKHVFRTNDNNDKKDEIDKLFESLNITEENLSVLKGLQDGSFFEGV